MHLEFPQASLDATFPVNGNRDALESALEALCITAERAVDEGKRILILADWVLDTANAPIPMLLAVSAVHQHLLRVGKRWQTSIIAETGDARDVHHFACLLGYGANAIYPYLALATVSASASDARRKQARFNLGKLKIVEMEEATMEAAIQWCYDNDRYPETNRLVDGMGYYYHVRGMWDKKVMTHPLAAEIASRHQDRRGEVNALSKLVQVLSRQSNWKEADRYRPRMRALVAEGTLPDEDLVEYLNNESFYWLARDKISEIEQLWQQNIHLADSNSGHLLRGWLADCLLAKREWKQAEELLRTSLNEVTEKKIQRGIIAIRIKLIANLPSHPEWDPVLFPEKYLPKDPAKAASAASWVRSCSQAKKRMNGRRSWVTWSRMVPCSMG